MWTAVLLSCFQAILFVVFVNVGCKKKKKQASSINYMDESDPRAKSTYEIKTDVMFPGMVEQKAEIMEQLKKEEAEALKKAKEEAAKREAAAKT
ncbi:hypothetical protein L596_015510 [Steinernema carpocapsae]|uniref:Uncharacterized protein n=1 Tax=Steinernema carpocapsae TaxID=34508 RepID=A0A4U5NF84_STECR|nr:hypothetical protein L596_015510 [Steinernema carpocapsae]